MAPGWCTEMLLLGGHHHDPTLAQAFLGDCHGTQPSSRVHVLGNVAVTTTLMHWVGTDASSTSPDLHLSSWCGDPARLTASPFTRHWWDFCRPSDDLLWPEFQVTFHAGWAQPYGTSLVPVDQDWAGQEKVWVLPCLALHSFQIRWSRVL